MPVPVQGGGAVTGYREELETALAPVLADEGGAPVAVRHQNITYVGGWGDAAKNGAEVWAIDIGSAVEVAKSNNQSLDNVRVAQADIHHQYRRTGRRDEARDHLTTATTMYREMDMRFWLEQAEAEMSELG